MKPKLRWVVQAGDGERVADVLAQLPAAAGSRVFLNGRPAKPEERLEENDIIELWPARPQAPAHEVSLLRQRDGVLLVYKPAGIPCETTQLGEISVHSALLERFKGGRVHIASRLDTQVSGVLVATLGKNAAQRLHVWRERRQFQRTYLALAQHDQPRARRKPLPDEGDWRWPLGKRRDRAGRHLASPHGKHPRKAHTRYRVLARVDDAEGSCLLQLQPQTGRFHQLRAHAALAQLPLLGDRSYGGARSVVGHDGRVEAVARVLLHAWRVDLPGLTASSPVPETFVALWRLLGGDAAAWRDLALAPPDA